MSTAGNIGEALKRSLSYLAPEARAEIQKLINPETLAIVAAVLVGWVGSHAFGVGEIVDLVLLTLGILAIGLSVFEGIDELYLFAKLAINAASPQDLDAAGKHFARAVAILGIQAILAVLLKGAPKTFRGGRINIGQVPAFVEGPVSRPPLVSTRAMRAGEGATNAWGKIVISRLGTATDRRLAALHENIHRLLTPKLDILRNFRVANRSSSYTRSALSKYLEEALAEMAAQVGVNGVRAGFQGVTFPVKFGYVTLLREVQRGHRVLRPFLPELGGLSVEGFIFGGLAYEIWWTPTEPKQTPEP
jgi:hypothetical protein